MARATAIKPPSNIALTLHLTPEEAHALKAAVQNPWGPDEQEAIAEIRKVVWQALNSAGVTL